MTYTSVSQLQSYNIAIIFNFAGSKKFVVSFELFSQLNFILIDYHFCILDFFLEDGSRVQNDWLF